METHTNLVAYHHFPGPDGDSETTTIGLRATPITSGSSAPAVYRVTALNRRDWKALYRGLLAGKGVEILGSPPRLGTRHAVLVFDLDDGSNPLCLAGRINDRNGHDFSLHIERPALSWRLAAVDFGLRLPPQGQAASTPTELDEPEIAALKGRRLRLRPGLPGSGRTLAPTAELADVITALRAKFYDIDDLLKETQASPSSTLSYLAALDSVGILVDAPRPLRSACDPFSFLGLHWSAYGELIERNHRGLRHRVSVDAGGDSEPSLSQAYDLLRQRRDRRRVRHTLVAPPVIGEVTSYLRNLLERAICSHRTELISDLSRRVLELDPTDAHVREVLEATEDGPS